MGEGYEGYERLRIILANQSQNLINEIKQRRRNIRAEKCLLCDDSSGEAVCNDDFEIYLIHMKIDILNKVEYVLKRLEAGEYGRCLECKEEISEGRLEAIPFAFRCRECEGKHEKHELKNNTNHR